MNKVFMYLAIQLMVVVTNAEGTWEINCANSVETDESWRNLTDTATVVLPAKVIYQDAKRSIKDFIKAGDKIEIWAGYKCSMDKNNDQLNKEFEGFVASVGPNIPVEIKCEDYMYVLKRTPVKNKYYPKFTMDDLKGMLPDGITLNHYVTNELGAFLVENATVATVLAKLKEKHGLFAYMRGKELVIGTTYAEGKKLKAEYEFNLKENIKKSNLEFRRKDDFKINLNITIKKTKGKDIHIKNYGPDVDGATRTVSYVDISESEAKAKAKEYAETLKVEGYKGSIKAYGVPFVTHGEIISVIDPEYPDKSGNYFTDRKKLIASPSEGLTRELTIGSKAG